MAVKNSKRHRMNECKTNILQTLLNKPLKKEIYHENYGASQPMYKSSFQIFALY